MGVLRERLLLQALRRGYREWDAMSISPQPPSQRLREQLASVIMAEMRRLMADGVSYADAQRKAFG